MCSRRGPSLCLILPGGEWEGHGLIPLQRYIAEAERALATLPSPKRVFIASDSVEAIEVFTRHFGDAGVVFVRGMERAPRYEFNASSWQDAISPQNLERALHPGASWQDGEGRLSDQHRFRSGAGALVDAVLLSRCSILICWDSAVARLALLFNERVVVRALSPPRTDTDTAAELAAAPNAAIVQRAAAASIASAVTLEAAVGVLGLGEQLRKLLPRIIVAMGDLDPVVAPPTDAEPGLATLHRVQRLQAFHRQPLAQSLATVDEWAWLIDVARDLDWQIRAQLPQCVCPGVISGADGVPSLPREIAQSVLVSFVASTPVFDADV